MSHKHPTSSDQRVNQKRYVAGYLRAFGVICPKCRGFCGFTGGINTGQENQWEECSLCNGVGYVEKRHVNQK